MSLASKFNGEIINGDAMQMYRGLPIITNQIPEDEREGVPHHLLGNVGLDEEPWHVGKFAQECQKIIKEIRSRGKLPVLVGGTHYYTQAVLFKNSVLEDAEQHDFSKEAVVADTDALVAVQDPILDASTEEMLARLKEIDPIMANRWHPKDRRKIRRSLEIYFQTGRKASEIYEEKRQQRISRMRHGSDSDSSPPFLLFWAHTPGQYLNTRLDKRVDGMLEDGLLDEARTLFNYQRDSQAPIDKSSGIWVSIGYKEFEPFIEAEETGTANATTLESLKLEAVEKTKVATRQYAKRQERWIRIKLGNALVENGDLNRLFVLNTSEVTEDRWDQNVTSPAFLAVKHFLAGEPWQDPNTVSELASTVLSSIQSKDSADSDDGITQVKTCEICNKVLATSQQWDDHLKSRGHKAVLRAREKKAVGRPSSAEREAIAEERRRKRELKVAQAAQAEDASTARE